MRHDHLFIGGQWVESESGEVYTLSLIHISEPTRP